MLLDTQGTIEDKNDNHPIDTENVPLNTAFLEVLHLWNRTFKTRIHWTDSTGYNGKESTCTEPREAKTKLYYGNLASERNCCQSRLCGTEIR